MGSYCFFFFVFYSGQQPQQPSLLLSCYVSYKMFEKKTQGFLGDYKKPYAYIYILFYTLVYRNNDFCMRNYFWTLLLFINYFEWILSALRWITKHRVVYTVSGGLRLNMRIIWKHRAFTHCMGSHETDMHGCDWRLKVLRIFMLLR